MEQQENGHMGELFNSRINSESPRANSEHANVMPVQWAKIGKYCMYEKIHVQSYSLQLCCNRKILQTA